MRRVVITGMGMVSPLASGVDASPVLTALSELMFPISAAR